MSQFFQQLANGTILGATYGLIALGYTMVYGVIQLINFAHGEIFMVGAFGGYTAYHYLLPDSVASHAWVALPVMLVVGMAASVLVAVVMERFAYRPLRNAPRLAPLISAIGVSIALQEGVRVFYPGAKNPIPFPRVLPDGGFNAGGVRISWTSIFLVAVAVGLMVALELFIRRSRTGRAMRATAQDPDTSRLMGIDTDRIIVITFVIGAALAAVGGVANGMRIGVIQFDIGFLAGLKAFTAAVLGGIGNVTGAVLGGFVLGLVEALSTQYVPGGSEYKDVFAFVVLILVLVFRPSGLLGEQVATRA